MTAIYVYYLVSLGSFAIACITFIWALVYS